jgi:hypothetical protein
VSEFNKLANGSFVDYERAKTFQFDHLNNKAFDWEDYAVEADVASTMYVQYDIELITVHRSVNRSERTRRNITLLSLHMLSTLHYPRKQIKIPTQSSL